MHDVRVNVSIGVNNHMVSRLYMLLRRIGLETQYTNARSGPQPAALALLVRPTAGGPVDYRMERCKKAAGVLLYRQFKTNGFLKYGLE